ncbi:MAG: hypothetical protein ACJ76I_11990 [Gaiellaceae bacterium]
MSSIDYTHPLHAASLYVEELKYGPGARVVEGATRTQIVAQFDGLLRDAGVEGVDAGELVDDTDYYARSSARAFQVHPLLAKSVFVDGLMHGIALAGGLKGRAPA